MADHFEVPGAPDTVRLRLQTRLLRIRSLWFPPSSDADEWRESDALLYIRWTGPLSFEIGPRTLSLNAARLCPVWRGTLEETGSTSTRVSLQRGLPRSTELLLMGWLAVVGLWALILGWQWSLGDDMATGWMVWWAILASLVLGGPAVGWVIGGQQLLAHRDWLQLAAAGTDPLHPDPAEEP